MTMLAKAQKWGNSLAVRLPKSVAEECGITADSPVEVSRENDLIVIRPVKKKFSLEKLLAEVTPENMHSEVATGTPRGKELL
jgi:antitoxin MazE